MNDFRFMALLSHLLLNLSLILAITAGAAPQRRVIKNPEMNQWHAKQRRYVNLFDFYSKTDRSNIFCSI